MKVFKALIQINDSVFHEIITIQIYSVKMARNRIRNSGLDVKFLCEEKEFDKSLHNYIQINGPIKLF